MDEKAEDVEYLTYNLMLLRKAALLKLEKSGTFSQTLLHHLLRSAVRLIVGITFLAVLIDTINKWGQNVGENVMNYMYLGCTFYVVIITNYYYYFEDCTEKIINDINRIFKYQTRTGFEEKNMSKTMQVAKLLTICWFWLAFFISDSLIIAPLVFGGYTKKILPVPAWYPYNYFLSPYYELTAVFQFLNQTCMIMTVPATDMFFASTSLMISQQFEILSWEIKHLFYTNLLRWGIPMERVVQFRDELNVGLNRKEDDLDTFSISQEFHNNLLRDFNDLIRFHQALISLSMNMEDFFSPLILTYFVPIAVIIMPYAYSLMTTRDLDVLVLDVLAGTWFLFEVLFLGYFGELIMEKSEEVHTSLYDMPWYFCDKKFISYFKLIHQRTSMPVTLTVGKFKNLGLNMFVWTLKSVYSFTTVLRNMKQRN